MHDFTRSPCAKLRYVDQIGGHEGKGFRVEQHRLCIQGRCAPSNLNNCKARSQRTSHVLCRSRAYRSWRNGCSASSGYSSGESELLKEPEVRLGFRVNRIDSRERDNIAGCESGRPSSQCRCCATTGQSCRVPGCRCRSTALEVAQNRIFIRVHVGNAPNLAAQIRPSNPFLRVEQALNRVQIGRNVSRVENADALSIIRGKELVEY